MSTCTVTEYVHENKWKSAMIACGVAVLFISSAFLIKNMNTKKEKEKKRKYIDYFKSKETIDTGTFAHVKRCIRKFDKKEFAAKIVDKRPLTQQELRHLMEEIQILKHIKHSYVINLVDVFDSRYRVFMVLEICHGGNLFDQMEQETKRRLNELQSALVLSIIAKTLEYLHNNGVIHRDLKPENILFTSRDRLSSLKITDFGMAHYLKLPPRDHFMHTCCGSPFYAAPEILTSDDLNAYSYQVDFWALGVILYIMLSGYQPFNSQSIPKMYDMIQNGYYRFHSPYWDSISNEAKDLVQKLICVDPKKRYSTNQIIQHQFIAKHMKKN